MPRRMRIAVLSMSVVVFVLLIAAHIIVAKYEAPSFFSCGDRSGHLQAHGFGGDEAPRHVKACVAGAVVPVTTRVDRNRGELLFTSKDQRLAMFDGRRALGDLRVDVRGVDHSKDIWPARALEFVTPFQDFDQTWPQLGSESAIGNEEGYVKYEANRPRLTRAGTELELSIELGDDLLEDRSLTVDIFAQPLA